MSEQPLVSILLLSMNHEPYIEKCIQSIAAQTYQHIEMIYLDNASADETYSKGVSALKATTLPHHSYQNTTKQGISKNFNFLLEKANGELVMPLSTDDWLTEDSVAEKVNYFLANKDVGLVYSSCYFYYYDTGRTVVTPHKHRFKSGNLLSDLLKQYCISTVGYMLRTDALKAVGSFDEQSLLEDRDVAIRMAEKYPIGYIDKELAYYGRRETGNITLNYNYILNGQEYIINKFSHYKETKVARELWLEQKVYFYATYEPSFKTLKFIIKNFRPKMLFVKQMVKTIKNMVVK
jgi:teichuronic acid biosynthesis glycosyltransferase TuaG